MESAKPLYLAADRVHPVRRSNGGLPDVYSGCGRAELAMSKLSIVKEFWIFLRERKKWWLAPIVISLLLLGCLLIFAKSSALAPFIYSLF